MNDLHTGELLLNEGLIDEDKLKAGLEESSRTGQELGQVLVGLGYLVEDDILRVMGRFYGLQVVYAHQMPRTMPEVEPRPAVKFLKHNRVLPLGASDGVMKVAVADPLDPYPLEALRASTGLEVDAVLSSGRAILEQVDTLYGTGSVSMNKLIEGIGDKELDEAALEGESIEHLKDMALEAPIVNLVNLLITRAMEKRVSDIHIEPFDEGVHVRYRIDGILYLAESLPKKLNAVIASRIKIMAKLNIAERRLPQDGRIKYKGLGRDIDIRVSTVPTLYGESIVMRLLDPAGKITVDDIGLSPANRAAIVDLIRLPHGMLLVTGPTGSGKSTTLYASLSKIDSMEKKVITIEDPIEYNIDGVNQIQVKPKIGLSFADGLRSVVRQDPDVIMVGEIRDAETADIAIHSALTGHLMLSSLHTNDAPSAVTRLQDMGIESFLISSSLLGVLAQRLVRVICPHCKVPYTPDAEVFRAAGAELDRAKAANNGTLTFWKGAGCDKCDNNGYKGRTGIFELMLVNEEIRQLIVEKKGASVIRQKAIENGMVTLREDGWKKVLEGVTTPEEVVRVTLE